MGWYQNYYRMQGQARSYVCDSYASLVGLDAGDRNLLKSQMQNIPIVGDIIADWDSYNYYSDYLKNRGMSWSDVKYPSRTLTGMGYEMGSSVNFVSSNVRRLYR